MRTSVDSGDTGTSVIATDPSTLYNKDINHTGDTHERMGKLGDMERFPLDQQR